MRRIDFSEEFWPQDNPFRISIARVLIPKQPEPPAPPGAILIKLRYVVSLPISSTQDTELFQSLVKTLSEKKSFCGLWTPEMSEPYYEAREASVELTSYLRMGSEDRILHLDHVARASQERKEAETEDDYLLQEFVKLLHNGKRVDAAAVEAERKTRERFSRGEGAEVEMESGGIASDHTLGPRKPPAQRPPPGPGLRRAAPPGPQLPGVPPAEPHPQKSELAGAPLLGSKGTDGELELSHNDVSFDIRLQKTKPRRD